jgi:hypothetical protein
MVVAVLGFALVLAQCRRTSGPDANFAKASQMYQRLYATQLDEAYGDPQMDDVVRLLGKVNPRSVDAESAKALLGTIERGRQALAKERAAREQMAAAAAASAKVAAGVDPEKILAASAPDAGPPADPFGAGASISEINAATGGCLAAGEPFQEEKTNTTGTVYRLVESPGCVEKLSGFVGQAVLVVDGRIYRRMSGFARPSAPPPPDAGPAVAKAPAPSETGAGAVEHRYYYPGQPIPTASSDAGP